MRSSGMRHFTLTLGLVLSACSEEPSGIDPKSNRGPPGSHLLNQVEHQDGGKGSSPQVWKLQALNRGEIETNLESGAGCTLSEGDRDLMVAVLGAAVVKLGDETVHLKPEASTLNDMFEGGRFAGNGVSVEVIPGVAATQHDEVISRAAIATATVQGQRIDMPADVKWDCGA